MNQSLQANMSLSVLDITLQDWLKFMKGIKREFNKLEPPEVMALEGIYDNNDDDDGPPEDDYEQSDGGGDGGQGRALALQQEGQHQHGLGSGLHMLARKATTPWMSCMRTTSLTLRESPQQLTEGWLNTFMQ